MSQAETASRTVTGGFTLTVTPQITVDGVVHSSVNPNVTHDTGVATSPSRVAVPVITVREADTVARVRHGETIVIGLLQAGEPIGSVKRRKTDLVILLTPTLTAR